MWQKFKSLNTFLKVIIGIIAICFLPITLAVFSIEFLMKAIEAKNKSKIILGCFLALLTLSCARTVYLTRDLDDKNSTQVNQVSSNKDKEDAEKKIKEETKNKRKLRKKEEIEKNSKEDNKGKVETKKQTLTGEELKKKVDSIIPAEYKGNYYTNDVLDTDGSYVLSLQVQNASFDNESSCKVFTKDLINKLKEFRIDSAEIYFVGSSGQTTYQINIDDFLKVQDNVNSVDNMEFFSFKDFKN
ncbi:TPA: hypothetical protein ACMVTQ_003566 [Clostridioides difficile]|uniref:hypothetical protein n=1 Tax=Clostridioides difficile TaxID=1496 RepID=UPI00038C6A22|nr:hypothetical protein [Clostridioides difficile]EQG78661.1 hypothetical protein QKA_0356 [Clostridioides difficile DA00165]EAA0008370.1 hypothetical protein [Clostridioides difficile]EGT3777076.1 hypothetical protein [Clostridioides difficile]EGT3855850.1 hypothetical protein [Clostridioides difficile]EGT4055185.1 hypothetical protein [Clostridioides difficile]